MPSLETTYEECNLNFLFIITFNAIFMLNCYLPVLSGGGNHKPTLALATFSHVIAGIHTG